MWWSDLDHLTNLLTQLETHVDDRAEVDPTAVLSGAVRVGAGTRICAGVFIEGPVVIGRDCLIGNNTMIRGATWIGDRVRIGFSAEVKASHIDHDVSIGPQCFVADSRIDDHAYLGAQVRTSNQRLDRQPIKAMVNGALISTGRDKLGCHIGQRSSLGVQVIILPGRTVAANAMFEPRVTVNRNLPAGRYRLVQNLESY